MIKKLLHKLKRAVLDRVALIIFSLWVLAIGMIAPRFTVNTIMELCDATKKAMKKDEVNHD